MSIFEIKNCKYICTLGLIQACNQENRVLNYDENVNETHDFSNIENIREGSCVVIKSDMIAEFIHRVLPESPLGLYYLPRIPTALSPFVFWTNALFIARLRTPK
jgi:hypothetical protein